LRLTVLGLWELLRWRLELLLLVLLRLLLVLLRLLLELLRWLLVNLRWKRWQHIRIDTGAASVIEFSKFNITDLNNGLT